jgi:predicted amidophosphoribosyltransferase
MELMQRKIRYNENIFFKMYHLCYYFSKPGLRNEDVKLILDFKNKDESAIRHFIIKALENLQHHTIDADLIIIRALHSFETVAGSEPDNALDRLGQSLSTVFDCTYYPEIISKTRPTGSIKSLTIAQRKKEIEDVYRLKQDTFNFNYRKVLIIDDVVTSGTTVCAIMTAILDAYPKAEIEVFCLAWTPTLKQQEYFTREQNQTFLVNEPPSGYSMADEWIDEDFESGKTQVSIYS